MSHPPPVLNYDVLSTVLEQAERETLLSLMLCCRTLYQEGVRVLLADPVCLHRPCWKERRFLVGCFTRFMSADGGQRWRFLRGLIFGDRGMFYHAAAKLAEGIKQAPNITSLVLLDADGLLRTYPELLTALASLENVKHLALTGAASHTCLLLESVRWPLVTAKLIGTPIRNPGPNVLAKMHPTALFRCAQNTLVAMRCDSCDLFEYHSGNPTYPNVTFLDMTNTEPSTHEWVKAYPNVSSLRVSNRYYKVDDVRDEAWFQTAHERNMHALVDQCWPQLKRCDAFCVADLYALGLPCHIRAIKFDWTMTSRDLRFFPETMEHARPDHLQLYLTIQRLATFQTTFQQAANGLRNLGLLRITVEFGSDSMDEDIPHSLVCVSVSTGRIGWKFLSR